LFCDAPLVLADRERTAEEEWSADYADFRRLFVGENSAGEREDGRNGTPFCPPNEGVLPEALRLGGGIEISGSLSVEPAPWSNDEVFFPLPTNRKPSMETGAADIICHPELAKSLS